MKHMKFDIGGYPFKLILLLSSVFMMSACQMLAPKPQGHAEKLGAIDPLVAKKYTSALQLMESGNDAAALKVFSAVSKLNDGLSGPYVNRGLIYLRKNEKEKAEQAFRDAIERNPKNVTALNQMGIVHRENKDFKAARSNYEAALAVDEHHPGTHINLGILCDIYLQDKSCAMQHYKAYQKINSDDSEVNNWIIDLQGRL